MSESTTLPPRVRDTMIALLLTVLCGAHGAVAYGGADGAALYATRCTACHGPEGHGNGPAGLALNPRPPDLTDPGLWATGEAPIVEAIAGGGVGRSAAMHAWGGVLGGDGVRAVADYLRERFAPVSPPFTVVLYVDRGAAADGVIAVTSDGQEVTTWQDGAVVGRSASTASDLASVLWRTPAGAGDAPTVVAAFLYDALLSEDQIVGLASCRPAPASHMARCELATPCACPAPAP